MPVDLSRFDAAPLIAFTEPKEKDALVAAYMRDDLLEERRVLMQDWADYVTGGTMPLRLADAL